MTEKESKLQKAVEQLKSRGVKTGNYVFSLTQLEKLDPTSQCGWVKKDYIVKEKKDGEYVLIPLNGGGQ